jgi:Large eukaryotic DNA virus major capsid protein.
MGGGLINIVTYGTNDLYLTGSPQITFFKIAYRRYTNFSAESVAIDLGNINFDQEITIHFPKAGDLFSNTYLQLEIPNIHLLKTDTTADLTDAELAFLNTALALPLTAPEIAIVNNYQNILTFLTLNCKGYRVAVDNRNIQNQTVNAYVTAILAAMPIVGAVETNYISALNAAKAYENSVSNTSNDFTLTYQNSDIIYILNTNVVIPAAYSSFTVAQIYNMVVNAITISVRVKTYYFNKVNTYNTLYQESVSRYAKFAWIDKLGHAIIDRIDVNIGGEKIDRHYSEWINIWYELTGHTDQNELYNKLIGNVSELTTFDRNEKSAYTLTIPLSFWFCRKGGLAFPIIALQYSTISLTIKLKKINDCAYVEALPTIDGSGNPLDLIQLSLTDIWDNMGFVLHGTLLVDYIYLDSPERKRFAQSAHEYLIEVTQRLTVNDISSAEQNINLSF